MKRSAVSLFLAAALGSLAAPLAAAAQPAGKVYRIGVLVALTRASVKDLLEEFERALGTLGWVQGRNLVIEYRWSEGQFERLPALAAELVRLPVDLIVAAGTPAIR